MIATIISFVSVALLVFIDQAAKMWAVDVLKPVGNMPFIPNVMDFYFVLNTGMAFSLFSGRQTFLIVTTSIGLLVVAYFLFFKTKGQMLKQSAFICILAGGIGNLIDRVSTGAVVDYFRFLFIDFAVFNFADICVCVGAGLYIICIFMEEKSAKEEEKSIDANNA